MHTVWGQPMCSDPEQSPLVLRNMPTYKDTCALVSCETCSLIRPYAVDLLFL